MSFSSVLLTKTTVSYRVCVYTLPGFDDDIMVQMYLGHFYRWYQTTNVNIQSIIKALFSQFEKLKF